MKKKYLITGGTGFFGRALLRYLLSTESENETSICVLSRNPERFKKRYPSLSIPGIIKFCNGDIENRLTLPWNQTFTHVLHAATDSTLGLSLSPIRRYQQIVSGTANVLDLALATGASRFLLTSSGGIYGTQPPELNAIPENWAGSPSLHLPSNAYSQAKRAAEYLCTLYFNEYNLETVVARCFAFVGPDLPLDAHFAIGNFIGDALRSPSININGDGTPFRTYLYQSDLAYWLNTLLIKGKSGHAYNVGSDEVISIAELAYLVRDILAPTKPVLILQKPSTLKLGRNRYIPDISKARNDLGLHITVPLREAIARTASCH